MIRRALQEMSRWTTKNSRCARAPRVILHTIRKRARKRSEGLSAFHGNSIGDFQDGSV
ncbi:hypothetical protein C8J55DRAFT_505839, partial [Lentinula edodes]